MNNNSNSNNIETENYYRPVYQTHDKVIIIGGGESLKGFDFHVLDDFTGAIITVNRVIDHVPRSNYWITIDMAWAWTDIIGKNPRCYYLAGVPCEKMDVYRNIKVHKLLRVPSFSLNRNEIVGGNSAYGALNLAYHFEARQILLLGIDACGDGHWHPDGGHLFNNCPRSKQAIDNLPNLFKRSLEHFKSKHITIINGSLISRINCFPRLGINDALHWIGVQG